MEGDSFKHKMRSFFFFRAFTPQLGDWYKKFKKGPKGDNLEIVFVSSDRDKDTFKEYFEEMPWLALSYEERDKKVVQLCLLYKSDALKSRPPDNVAYPCLH